MLILRKEKRLYESRQKDPPLFLTLQKDPPLSHKGVEWVLQGILVEFYEGNLILTIN